MQRHHRLLLKALGVAARDIESEHSHVRQNSAAGRITVRGRAYFFKSSRARNIEAEKQGFSLLQGTHPIPQFIASADDGEWGVLVCQYEDGFDRPDFALSDWLHTHRFDTPAGEPGVLQIWNVVREAALCSLRIGSRRCPADAITCSRLAPSGRYWQLYGAKSDHLPDELCYKNWRVNGHSCGFKVADWAYRLAIESESDAPTVCGVMHGDCTPHNVAIKPLFVDLACAGMNAISADLATTFWSLYATGGYLAPHYAPHLYHRFPQHRVRDCRFGIVSTRSRLGTCEMDMTYELASGRGSLLSTWEEVVFRPLITAGLHLHPRWSWTTEFGDHLRAKMLALYDIGTFATEDRLFIASHLVELAKWEDAEGASTRISMPFLHEPWCRVLP